MSGGSFLPEETVAIKYDGGQVARATTDLDGVFSTSFMVPKSASGNHSVVVLDGVNEVRLSFTMESSPPPVPALISPTGNFERKELAYFNWGEVDDPSGVSYTLEVAPAMNFSAPILRKAGLSNSEYTVREDEQLPRRGKDEPYYWRVKAVDGAANESEWSPVRSFSVGFSVELPRWAEYSLIILGSVLVIFVLVWLVRNAAGLVSGRAASQYQGQNFDQLSDYQA